MVEDELVELFDFGFADIIADVFGFVGIGTVLTCFIGFICWGIIVALGTFKRLIN